MKKHHDKMPYYRKKKIETFKECLRESQLAKANLGQTNRGYKLFLNLLGILINKWIKKSILLSFEYSVKLKFSKNYNFFEKH